MARSTTTRGAALDHVPGPEPGLTCLRLPRPRSASFHRFALGALPRRGVTYWIDAASLASSYLLYDLAPSERRLSGLRVARAFTAYQHFSLARETVRRVSGRTAGLLVPNVTRLYRDDDVPAHEATAMLAAVVDGLGAVADDCDLPVVVSVARDDDLAGRVVDVADRVVRVESTRLGARFEGPDVETTAYWDGGHWQTTIPYWVDLCGAVGDEEAVRAAAAFGIEGVS